MLEFREESVGIVMDDLQTFAKQWGPIILVFLVIALAGYVLALRDEITQLKAVIMGIEEGIRAGEEWDKCVLERGIEACAKSPYFNR